jgi:hypothetical protein
VALNQTQRDALAQQIVNSGSSVAGPGSGRAPGLGGSSGGGGSGVRQSASLSYYSPSAPNLQAPATITYDYNIGWNTRAHYIQPIGPAARISFRALELPAGIVIGLTRNPQDVGYQDIEYGFFITHQLPPPPDQSWGEYYAIVRNGELVDLPVHIAGASTHPRYTIQVRPGRIDFWVTLIDPVTGDDLSSTLVHSENAVYEFWQLSTALFRGGDKITELVVEQGDGALLSIPAVGVFSSDDGEYTAAMAELPAITVTAYEVADETSADLTIPAVRVLGGDGSVILSSISIPPVQAIGFFEPDSGPIVDLTFASVEVPPVFAFCICYDLTVATVDLEMPAVAAFASDSEDVTMGRPVIPAILVAARDTQDLGRVSVFEFVYAIHVSAGFEAYYLVLNERAELLCLVSAVEIESAILREQINALDTWTLTDYLQAVISSIVSVEDMASISGQALQVWALHMDSMGSTRYDGYNFNSFATIDGVTYGAAEGGIYRLDGNDDDGTPIRSEVDFGSLDFGTNNRKALPYVYAGMAADGTTYLRVTAMVTGSNGRPTEQTYTYQVRDNTEGMKTHRFELGRGLESNFYGLKLVSEDAAFDLHNIEFMPLTLKRRL